MRAIFKREFVSAFHRLYGFMTAGVTALAAAILFIFYNLIYSNENVAAVLSALSIISALVIPVIAVNAFPSRKRTDTDRMWDMLPVSTADVVLGKYFAALAVVITPNALVVLLPIISGMFSAADHKMSYSMFLAYVLFEAAYLAVCMLIARLSKSRVRAYIYCYILAIVWYFIGIVNVLIPLNGLVSFICLLVIGVAVAPVLYLLTRKLVFSVAVALGIDAVLAALYFTVPSAFVGLMETVLDKVSIFKRLDGFMGGVFDLESILFFCMLGALFVFLTYRSYEHKYVQKKREGLRITSAVSVMLAVLLVGAVCLATVGMALVPDRYTAFDATLGKKNSVGNDAAQYLSGIDEQVNIYILEPTGMENYELYLEKLAACNDNIKLEKVYYSARPEFYTSRGINIEAISANSLLIESQERMRYLSYMEMFVYSNSVMGFSEISASDYYYYYQLFSSNADYSQYLLSLEYDTSVVFIGDRLICNHIEYVTADIIPAIYWLTGHGEKDANASDSPYSSIGLPSLEILSDGIPEGAASILINMPTSDITVEEKDMLLAYLAGGGQITVVTGEGFSSLTNLCTVLSAYGMSADERFVTLDVTPEEEETEQTEDTENTVPTQTTTFTPDINTNDDVLAYLEGSGIEFEVTDANPITVTDTADTSLIHYPLLTVDVGEGEQKVTYAVAYAAETGKGARVVWFTGGESYNSSTSNAAAAVFAALGWTSMQYESVTEKMPSRVYQQPTVIISSGGTKLFGFLLIAIPVAVAAIGGVIYYKRRCAK